MGGYYVKCEERVLECHDKQMFFSFQICLSLLRFIDFLGDSTKPVIAQCNARIFLNSNQKKEVVALKIPNCITREEFATSRRNPKEMGKNFN